MLNKVLLTGRLTANPDSKVTQSGTAVATFTLAVQRNFKNGSGEYDADFINCVAWRGTADFISRFFEKGQLITIVGTLQSRSFEDRNGNKRTIHEVVADEAMFAESRKERSQTDDDSIAGLVPPPEPAGNDTEFTEVVDDELPF